MIFVGLDGARLADPRPVHGERRHAAPRPPRGGGGRGSARDDPPAALPHRLDEHDDRRLAARAPRPRLHPLLAGHRPQGADHQRREARARGVEHGRVRRPDERHLRPVGHLPGRARERAPRLGPVQRLPVLGEEPPPGVVFPAEREAWARETLRAVEEATGFEALRAYLPWLSREEYLRLEGEKKADPYAHPVTALRRILVETEVYHRLASEWIARETPDLAIVYFQGTDSIGHAFAPFAPPRQPTVSEEDYARYSGVPELYFRHVDTLLGAYRALAEARGAVSSSPRTTGSSGARGGRRSSRASPTRPPASGTARTASTSRGGRASLPRPATPTAPARRRSRPRSSRSSACRAAWGWRSRCCPASPPRRQGRPLRRALPAGHARRDGERRERRRGDREAEGPRLHRRRRGHVGAGRGGGEHAHGRLVEQRGPRAARRGPKGGLGPRVREGARARPEPRVGAVEPERRAEPAEARAGPLGRPPRSGLRDGPPRGAPVPGRARDRVPPGGRRGAQPRACWTPRSRRATTSPRRGSSAAATASSPATAAARSRTSGGRRPSPPRAPPGTRPRASRTCASGTGRRPGAAWSARSSSTPSSPACGSS